GRGDGLARATLQFAVEADDRLERLIADAAPRSNLRQAEARVQRARLSSPELELECGSAARSLSGEELGQADVEGQGQGVEGRQLRLPLAVLDEGELAAGQAHRLAELIERESALAAEMTDALAEDRQVGGA